jgi:hypothetical protein
VNHEIAVQTDPVYDTQHAGDAASLRQLAAAMINAAVNDIRSLARRWKENPNAAASKHERSALAWIQNATSRAPFALRWCCEVINLDFGKAQRVLLSWLRVAPQTESTKGTESWAG